MRDRTEIHDLDLYMKYIGACSLLARLMPRLKDSDDRYCAERAVRDCAGMFPDRFEVIETHEGGLSLEPKTETPQ